MPRFSIGRGAILATIFAAAVATAGRSPQRAAARDMGSKPLEAAPVEWKLVGRAVAVVQSPRGPLAGFLIGRDALLTGGLAGVGPHEIRVTFADPLPPGGGASAPATWEATAITPVLFDADAEFSVIHLAPKGGVMPGDVYGVLGARDRAPSAGDRLHAIVVSADGQRRYASGPPIAEAPVGDVGQFSIRAGGGAPLCDETGCVVGVYLDGGPGNEVLMIAAVKRLMPSEGSAIASCAITEQREIHGAGSGGAGVSISGGGSGGGGLMGGGVGGGGGGGSPGAEGGNAFNPTPRPDLRNRFVPDSPHITDDPIVPDPSDPEPAFEPTPLTPPRDASGRSDPPFPTNPPGTTNPPGGPSNPPGGGGGGDDPPPIPEPSSLALLGAGAMLMLRRRGR